VDVRITRNIIKERKGISRVRCLLLTHVNLAAKCLQKYVMFEALIAELFQTIFIGFQPVTDDA